MFLLGEHQTAAVGADTNIYNVAGDDLPPRDEAGERKDKIMFDSALQTRFFFPAPTSRSSSPSLPCRTSLRIPLPSTLDAFAGHLARRVQQWVESIMEVSMRVAEVMTRDVIAVPVDATLVDAAEMMRDHNIGFLPVIASDVVVGVITDRDLVVRAICENMNPAMTPVRSVMSPRPVWCYEYDVLTDAADILANNHLHRLIVVDSNKRLSGLLSIDDLAANMSSDRLLGDLLRHVAAA